MLRYRAATFLIRAHFPETLFGMQTVEELDDVAAAKKVTPIGEPRTILPTAEPIAAIATPENAAVELIIDAPIETPSDEFNELKDEVVAFLNTRPEDWFTRLGKLKSNIMVVVDGCKDVAALRKIEARIVDMDEQYNIMVK